MNVKLITAVILSINSAQWHHLSHIWPQGWVSFRIYIWLISNIYTFDLTRGFFNHLLRVFQVWCVDSRPGVLQRTWRAEAFCQCRCHNTEKMSLNSHITAFWWLFIRDWNSLASAESPRWRRQICWYCFKTQMVFQNRNKFLPSVSRIRRWGKMSE